MWRFHVFLVFVDHFFPEFTSLLALKHDSFSIRDIWMPLSFFILMTKAETSAYVDGNHFTEWAV